MNAEPVTASIRIDAPPAVVFQYFTDAEKLLRWQGQHVKIDAVPGGRFAVDINGIPVRGEFVEVVHPHRIVLTWGHAGSEEFPPGASIVEIDFIGDHGATVIELVHRDIPDRQAPQHAVGWWHFLSRLSIAAAGGNPGPDPWATHPPTG